jgi:hypothetical protein
MRRILSGSRTPSTVLRHLGRLGLLLGLSGALGGAKAQAAEPQPGGKGPPPSVRELVAQFKDARAYPLPYDVPEPVVRQLVSAGQLAQAQALFDVFSWQAFLALNSPADVNGNPALTQTPDNLQAPRVWEFFRESGSVFLQDGARPEPWGGTSTKKPAAQASRREAAGRRLWMTNIGSPRAGHAPPLADESLQAFTGPLVDLNGNWVRYEVLINKTEFDYIYQNELYNLDGQAAFSARGPIEFPANDGTKQHGSMELKLAWKQLAGNDDPTRFFVRQAQVVHYDAGPDGVLKIGRTTLETMGLVGMHIAVRTQSSPTWIWATFEHVDNVNVNPLLGGVRPPLRPNFYNPETPVAPVNVLAAHNARTTAGAALTTWAENLTTTPTQVLQVLPVPGGTEYVNSLVQEQLRNQGSIFQYYKLIGTQWPTEPKFPAFPGGMLFGTNDSAAPESIVYKTPGKVVPVYLANTTMETFFQLGNQKAGPLAEDDRLPSGVVSDSQIVFGTESCVGCHYSAGACIGFKTDLQGRPVLDANGKRIPIFGKNANAGLTGSANYSWLLQMRAQARPYPPSRSTPPIPVKTSQTTP